jgi:acyl-CoA thioesterase-2
MPRPDNVLTEMQKLVGILTLEKIEENLFRGRSPDSSWQRVFGGQVIAQALAAANQTVVADRFVHSLHSYFLRPGDPTVPILDEVERIRDGGSFTTRRVVGIQHGKPIFTLSASYQVDEAGLSHQVEMPDIPLPEDLPRPEELYETYLEDAPEHVRRFWLRERPVEILPVSMEHYVSNTPLPPVQHIWFKANGQVPEERAIKSAVLAYLSDLTLLDTTLFPHGMSIFDRSIQGASLDHAMWFHETPDFDDWLLYTQDSPFSGGARGLSRGSIFSRSGRLIASTAQEGLIRKRATD